jgi:hypothetical protein
MGWWAPVCCGMSVHLCPTAGLCGVVGTGVLWDVSTLRVDTGLYSKMCVP